MERNKAISQLEQLIQDRQTLLEEDDGARLWKDIWEADIEALKFALEIIERRKPKSPIIEPYFYGAKFLCPKCSQFLGKEYNIAHINYCGKCGQAILIKEAKNE